MSIPADRLQQIQSLVSQLVGSEGSDAPIEVEARFGEFFGTEFRSGVTRRKFTRLRDTCIRLDQTFSQENLKDEIFRESSTGETERFTTVEDNSGLPVDTYRLVKTRVQNFDFPEWGYRISVSKEQVDRTPPPSGQPIYVRQKKRWSFRIPQLYEGRARLDLTEVTTYIPSQSLQSAKTVYEVELELMSPKISNLNSFSQDVTSTLREVQGTIILYTTEEKNAIIERVNDALGSRINVPRVIDNAPLAQARNLKLRDLVAGGIVPLTDADTSYTVTIKTDGVRKLLYFDNLGVYLVSPPDEVNKILSLQQGQRLQTWAGTLIEGEQVPIEHLSPDAPEGYRQLSIYFVMYDTLAVAKDTSIKEQSHGRRLEYTQKVSRALSGLGRTPNGIIPRGYLFETKNFHPFKTVNEFYREVRNVLDGVYPFLTDGIIFTPDNYSYFPPNTDVPLPKRRLTDQPDITKWKPRDQLTIDFEIWHEATADGPLLSLRSGVPGSRVWSEDHVRSLDRLYRDQVSRGVRERVPFHGSSKIRFNPRTDLVINPLIQNAPDGTIVEFKWTPLEQEIPTSQRGQLEAVRVRYDKTSPNNLDVALDVWEDIHSPLSLEMMRGDEFELVFRYHNREKKALYDALPKRPKVLLDVGSGRGGDVNKWITGGFSHVIMVEPSEENRNELRRRLVDAPFQYRIIPTVGQDIQTIIQQVNDFLPGKKVDVISYMLSLSFFFDSPKSVNSIIQLTDTLLAEGGHFIAFTVNGQYVKEFFNDPTKYHSINSVKRANFEMITMELRPNETVFINIPGSIVQNQIEYLVDLPELIRRLKEIGVDLVSQTRADKETFMTNEERVYSSLYSSVYLRRTRIARPPTQVPAPVLAPTPAAPLSRTTLPFPEFEQLYARGEFVKFEISPNQAGVPSGLTKTTWLTKDGREVDVLVNYNPATRQINAPRTTISFPEFQQLYAKGQFVKFEISPNQSGVPPGLTRTTWTTKDKREVDVIVDYNPATQQINPPK